ncbi:RNase A-like domain-containing protein, partial [Streptomyces sp. AK02-04a]|uniref:RNase A-like domain-containing protein n=1 Tax=Streptomyces sp. AK02-04a TaxID=3028649 RepID=UPI0029AB16AE
APGFRHARAPKSRRSPDSRPSATPHRPNRNAEVKPKYRADLAGDEGQKGAHTIERHVEKTDRELRTRMRADKGITGSSSFLSESSAQQLTDRALLIRQQQVKRWLEKTTKRELELQVDFGQEVTGRSMSREDFIRGTGPHNVHQVFVLVRRDPDMPSGFRIHTAYPKT